MVFESVREIDGYFGRWLLIVKCCDLLLADLQRTSMRKIGIRPSSYYDLFHSLVFKMKNQLMWSCIFLVLTLISEEEIWHI